MTVIRPRFVVEPAPFEALTDLDFHDAWERPVHDAISALSAAIDRGDRRIVVVLPSAVTVEVAGLAHTAAAVEAVRVAALSAAAACAGRGITVNVATVSPADAEPDPAVLDFLESEPSAAVTGQTIAAAT